MDALQTIDLYWEGPFSFKELLLNSTNVKRFAKPGVYLWVERMHNRLSYVGRSLSSLLTRHRQHNANQVGGLYNVPKEYRVFKQEKWVPNHKNQDVLKTLFSIKEFLELIQDAFRYRDDIEIYLCPLNQKKDFLKSLEYNLIYTLQPYDTKPGRLTAPEHKIAITHINAGWKTAVKEEYRNRINFR
jgi:hypothetical protein